MKKCLNWTLFIICIAIGILRVNASTMSPWPSRHPDALVTYLIGVLIDTGDQTDDLMCMVIKLEVKIEIRSPFWSRPKLGCQSGHPLGSQSSSLNDLLFKLISYLPKSHVFDRFACQSGHVQIWSSKWSSSNYDVNLVVVVAFSFNRIGLCSKVK